MGCGKILIFFALCTFVGALKITNNLEILVSVPSSHAGDTEIESAVFRVRGGHPFMYTIVAQKNETQCINSTDPLCSSGIKAPAVDVSLTLRSSNGKTFTYSSSVNRSVLLEIHVDPEVSVKPQIDGEESDRITATLDVLYDTSNTKFGSLSARRRPEIFTLNVEFITTTNEIIEGNGPGNGQGSGQGSRPGNGQSTLGSGPLSALLLLALLPVLLLQ